MNLLKTISMAFLFFTLFTAGYCDPDDLEDTSCDDCINAQIHYCEALLSNGCSATSTSTASGRVLDLCENGSAKLSIIRSQCQLGENLGCGGYTCD